MVKVSTVLVICSFVLLFLGVRNIIISQDFDCSECTVVLKNTLPNGDQYAFGEFVIEDLFNQYYKEGQCRVKWSATDGYSYG